MTNKLAPYRPWHGGYVSEFGQFIDQYLRQHPAVARDQKRGWYIWWDHNVDLDELHKQHADEVKVKPYSYD